MHILLIARHYPPEISGGARRPFLYVRALRKLGHRVTLDTPFKIDDEDTVYVPNAAINNGLARTEGLQTPARKNPLISMKAFIRDWVFWPDADIRWAKDVVKTLEKANVNPDWIMTTSPPESVHFAGAALSKKLGAPWVGELRDTWTLHPHRQNLARSPMRRMLERMMARSYLKHAAAITSVSEAVMAEARLYVQTGTPECIIPHFSAPPNTAFAFDKTRINLVHTGGFALSDHRRKLSVLITALTDCGRDDCVLHIAGRLTPEEITLCDGASIPIVRHGPVPLETSRSMQAGADALILHTPENSYALPGKYAEYAAAGKPILYIGSGDWLALAGEPNNLIPLTQGLKSFDRQQANQASAYLSGDEAAARFVDFLSAILRS